MDFFQGERVRCLGRAEWGTGFIVADSRNGKVRVRFQCAGLKLLSLRHAKLMKVKPPRPRMPSAGVGNLHPAPDPAWTAFPEHHPGRFRQFPWGPSGHDQPPGP